jgi:hypothetical protein
VATTRAKAPAIAPPMGISSTVHDRVLVVEPHDAHSPLLRFVVPVGWADPVQSCRAGLRTSWGDRCQAVQSGQLASQTAREWRGHVRRTGMVGHRLERGALSVPNGQEAGRASRNAAIAAVDAAVRRWFQRVQLDA